MDFNFKIAEKNISQRKNFFIRTYGCQMNERDSEKMAGLLLQLGFDRAASQDDADLILYNTCCVRESAEDKILGHLSRVRRLKAEKPGVIVAVGGCMPQQKNIAQLLREKHKYINLVFGTTNRHRLPEFLWRVMNGERIVDISEEIALEIDGVPVSAREFSHKAGVNVMYGCDNFCSYCIVPYVRGRERSRAVADILEETRALVADGAKEIMLLGQNVNSYAGEISFPELLREVNRIQNLKRIRFMTSHPKDFSDELIAAVRDCEKVCKAVHLPLQAGSSRVLKDMNRHYSKEDYISLAEKLYVAVPGLALTTDIIVGYPGETEEDFADTLDIVRKIKFAGAFTFIYSKRSGTPAAERTDLIPRKIASERFDRLTAELYPFMTEFNEKKIGHVFDVMIDEVKDGAYKGRTDDNILVHFSAGNAKTTKNCAAFLPGEIVPVKIDIAKTFYIGGIYNEET